MTTISKKSEGVDMDDMKLLESKTNDIDDNKTISDIDKEKDKTKTDSNNEVDKRHHIKWSPENEKIMVEWCDIAQCYKWLNSRAHLKYSYMHAWFTIPAIVLSTISGTASFAQSNLPTNFQSYSPMVIGALNIFIGILTTLQQYLKISELNEAHRVAAISWDKFARNIRIELSKEPMERTDAGQFIKFCRQEFDRLMETSPMISNKIVNEFNRSLKGDKGSDKRIYFEELKKPDICDTIISADRYRHPWYKEYERKMKEHEEREKERAAKEYEYELSKYNNVSFESSSMDVEDPLILKKKMELREKESEIIEREKDLEDKLQKRKEMQNKFHQNVVEAASRMREQVKKLDAYTGVFQTMYGRVPIKDELINHANELIGSGEITKDALDIFLEKHYNKKRNSAVVL